MGVGALAACSAGLGLVGVGFAAAVVGVTGVDAGGVLVCAVRLLAAAAISAVLGALTTLVFSNGWAVAVGAGVGFLGFGAGGVGLEFDCALALAAGMRNGFLAALGLVMSAALGFFGGVGVCGLAVASPPFCLVGMSVWGGVLGCVCCAVAVLFLDCLVVLCAVSGAFLGVIFWADDGAALVAGWATGCCVAGAFLADACAAGAWGVVCLSFAWLDLGVGACCSVSAVGWLGCGLAGAVCSCLTQKSSMAWAYSHSSIAIRRSFWAFTRVISMLASSLWALSSSIRLRLPILNCSWYMLTTFSLASICLSADCTCLPVSSMSTNAICPRDESSCWSSFSRAADAAYCLA